MFKTIGFFLFLAFCFLENFAQESKEESLFDYCKPTSSLYSKFSGIDSSNFNMLYMRANWEVDPNINYINGSIFYRIELSKTTNEITFDLSKNLQIDSILFHQQQVPFIHNSIDKVIVQFPNSIANHSIDSLTIYYQGAPLQTGFGAFTQSNHETGPIIWTLSEPFGAKEWWPSKESLTDKIDSIDLFITTTKPFIVGSNGLLKNIDSTTNTYTYHWFHSYPIAAYLVAFSVSNYAIYTDTANLINGPLHILNYVYPENLSIAKTQTKEVVPVLQLYESLVGAYPFHREKYGHAQCGFSGGMEHQTMSFMGNFNRGLVAHELAHQWFGDKVTCSGWNDIWLNEGFATYFAALINDFGVNPNLWNTFKTGTIQNVTSQLSGSVKVLDTLNVSSIFNERLSYKKASYLLHMLRGILGDTSFFLGLKNYLSDPNLAFDFSSTNNLQYHLEQTSGKNLQEFFNDWYLGSGFPTYETLWSNAENNQVLINISQTSSDNSVDFFEMPVPIKFSNAVADTTIIFNHLFSGQDFVINLNFKPTIAAFDPEHWLLAKYRISNTDEVLNFDRLVLNLYPNPSANQLNLEFSKAIELKKIEIYNNQGKLIKKYDYDQKYTIQEKVSILELESGYYLLKIFSKESAVINSFIKMK